LVVLLAALAVANRRPVIFSLDPFSDTHPALAFQSPLALLLFLALLLGVILGGLAAGLARIRSRRKIPPQPLAKSPYPTETGAEPALSPPKGRNTD
jgi:uncharacterized integral membrane protein